MDGNRKTQCSELLRNCSEALVDTPHLESFRHGQATLDMHCELLHRCETVSVLERWFVLSTGDVETKRLKVPLTRSLADRAVTIHDALEDRYNH
jgi:hypothetical protein